MNYVDQRIKELGFELLKIDYQINTADYEYKDKNSESLDRIVQIQWDDDDRNCVLFCSDKNEYYDDFGNEIDVSNGIDILEAKAFINKIYQMKSNTNHVSVGVYANGQHVVNVVRDEDLNMHIEYNKTMRFGRGLFIDGKCLNQGYLSGEQVKNWTKRISKMEIDITEPTLPYK